MPGPRSWFSLAAVLLATLAAGCAGVPGPDPASMPAPTAAWLDRFRDVLTFAPPGMQGYSLVDHRAAPAHATDGPQPRVELRSGRSFQLPTDVGAGAHDGVDVEDHGSAGVPAARLAALGTSHTGPDGLVLRHRPERARDTNHPRTHPQWAAIVPPGFVVVATSEARLREALARPGPPALDTFAPWPELEASTYALVLRAPGQFAGNAIAAVASSPVRVRLWTTNEADFVCEFWPEHHGWSASPLAAPPTRFGREFRARPDPTEVEPELAELYAASMADFGCLLFYGLIVFV